VPELEQTRKIVLALVVVAIVGSAGIAGLYALSLGRSTVTAGSSLPKGCVKPANGFLIIASDGGTYGIGYNDSEGHGAPSAAWPIITVPQNSTVTITVCNVDVQAHSFNIIHYLSGGANTIAPGQVLSFAFVASETGTFQIYCDIFCSIHIFMQSGELRVIA
jgi:hypothetical protein